MIGRKKHNFALIGAGRMGSRWADVIGHSPRAKLNIIVDENLEQAKKIAAPFGAPFFRDFKKALSRDIDAVAIVLPHAFLYPVARSALLAGKHVFLEKPGAKTANEMADLVKISRKKKLSLMVGFNYRFFDAVSRAKKVVDRGAIGKINFIRIKHGHAGRSGYEHEWRMNKKIAGGGVLMDQGLHVIDLANWFFSGSVKKIEAITSKTFWKSGVEDNAFVLLKTANGETASLQVGITEWKPVFLMEIFGEKGYCIVNGLGRKYGGKEVLIIGKFDHKRQVLKEKSIVCNPNPENALRRELAEFIKSIEESRDPKPSAEDAFKVLQIVGKAYKENEN